MAHPEIEAASRREARDATGEGCSPASLEAIASATLIWRNKAPRWHGNLGTAAAERCDSKSFEYVPELQRMRLPEVIRLRGTGLTYLQIGAQTGSSRTGVFDICKRYAATGLALLRDEPASRASGAVRMSTKSKCSAGPRTECFLCALMTGGTGEVRTDRGCRVRFLPSSTQLLTSTAACRSPILSSSQAAARRHVLVVECGPGGSMCSPSDALVTTGGHRHQSAGFPPVVDS